MIYRTLAVAAELDITLQLTLAQYLLRQILEAYNYTSDMAVIEADLREDSPKFAKILIVIDAALASSDDDDSDGIVVARVHAAEAAEQRIHK